MKGPFDLASFIFPVKEFMSYAGKGDKDNAEAYAYTQLKCFIEEAEEILETCSKEHGLLDPANRYAVADDIADTHFSGLGFLICINYDINEDDTMEDYTDYLDLLAEDPGSWSDENIVYVIENELKNIKGTIGNKKTAKKVLANRNVLTKFASRIMALATLLANRHHLDPDQCLDIVCSANLQKFDHCFDDACKSVDAYKEKGIEVSGIAVGQGVWAIISKKDQTIDDKFYPANKILKSHKWSEPVFRHLEQLI